MVLVNDPKTVLDDMRSRVQQQGDIVRKLKADKAPEAEVKNAIEELKARKKLLEAKEIELTPSTIPFDRTKLEDLLKQKFFYDQSFAIYGGVQGLYDYGPMGCAMKSNLLSAWRQHFVLEDHLLEVDCSMLTPHAVLQSSGHVDRFTDWMVKDVKTGECFRADHLVKANLESKLNHKKTSETEKEEIRKILVQLDNMGKDELDNIIRQFGMKSPNDNALTEAQEFNLMFATMIGPTGHCKGFLRPETAQGIFVNFQRLLQFNQGRIPFGAAQIGSAFRNEISPRSGLIRVREFTMAEIEYFVDPVDKRHPKFDQVRDVMMNFYSACDQMDGKGARKLTIGEAVDQRMVANETLGYFMARIHQFLLLIGVDENRLRFRQHLSNEMAHYACDCWDAECQTSYGWIECVGCADRSCFDLTQHTKATGARLVAEKRLAEPRLVKVHECFPHKEAIGKAFRGDAKHIVQRLSQLSLDEKLSISRELSSSGKAELKIGEKSYTIEQSMVQIRESETTMHVEEIVPNVIEPSFGIGRILYAVFEHSFRMREGDEQRTYLSLLPILAPYKCSVLPLSTNAELTPFVQQLSKSLTRHGVSHRVDESSGSIGRRYARTDQIAIPYGITVDFDTVNISPASATLRERDSMKQIRVPLDELPSLVSDLANGVSTWSEAQAKYPSFEQQETVTHTHTGAVPEEKPVDKKAVCAKHELTPAQSTTTTTAKLASQEVLTSSEEPLHAPDEWQSVCEDQDEVAKQPEQDMECWSSATETAAEQAELVRGLPDPCSEKSSPADHGKTAPKTTTSKLPRSWAECGVAIQRHYQAYRSKAKQDTEKPRPSTIEHKNWTAEVDEVRSSFSGYEADQEDNVASRSAGEPRPASNHELDTSYQLSPAVQSTDGEKDKQVSSEQSDRPYHGLFVGEGWPSEPVSSKKQVPTKEKPSKTDKLSSERQDGVAPATQSEPTAKSEWPAVLAQLTDRSCVPELWQFPSNMDVADNTLFSEQNAMHHSRGLPQTEKTSEYQEDFPPFQSANKVSSPSSSAGNLETQWAKAPAAEHQDKHLIHPFSENLSNEPAAQPTVHHPVCEPTLIDEPSEQEPLDPVLAAEDDSWQPWQSASHVWENTGATLDLSVTHAPASTSDHTADSAKQSIWEQTPPDHEKFRADPLVISSQPEPVSLSHTFPDVPDDSDVRLAPSIPLSSNVTLDQVSETAPKDHHVDLSTILAPKQSGPIEPDAVPGTGEAQADGPKIDTTPTEVAPPSSAEDAPTTLPAGDSQHPSTTNIHTEDGDPMVSSLKKGKSKRRKPKKKK